MHKVWQGQCPWDMAQVVKGWGGFVGGSRFKSQWEKNLPIKKKAGEGQQSLNFITV